MLKAGTITIEKQEVTEITGITTGADFINSTYMIQAATLSVDNELDTVDVIKWVEKLTSLAGLKKAVNLKIYIPEGSDVVKIRKILECCLFGTNLKVLIKLDKSEYKQIKPNSNNKAIMVVKANEGVSYADMVKDIKRNVSPQEMGIIVNKFEKTRNGDVRIAFTEKEKDSKARLSKRINEKVSTASKVSLIQRTKGIVILDVEDDIDQKEVIERLATVLSVTNSDIRLNDFRPTHRGTKMVTAYLPIPAATSAIQMKRLKLGWTMCRIKEKVDPAFCSKCQSFGHSTISCTGSSKEKIICMRCGDQNHMTRDCKNDEFCFTCNEAGHRANSMNCSKYKALVFANKQCTHTSSNVQH